MKNQRKVGFSESTSDIITKALQIQPSFKDGCYTRQRWWAYKFISRNSLVFRRPTRVSQYTPEEEIEARKAHFALSTMTVVHMNGINEHDFVNIDETAV